MHKVLLYILLLVLVSAQGVVAGEPQKGMNKALSSIYDDEKTYKELKKLETSLKEFPENAIKQLDVKVRYALDLNLEESIVFAYQLMGRAYKELEQPQLALHFMGLSQKRKQKRQKTKNRYKSSIDYSNIEYNKDMAEIHIQLGDYKVSNRYYKQYLKSLQNRNEIRNVKYQIASNYYALDNYQSAITKYKELLKEEKRLGNDIKVRECYSRLAACYISIDETDKGLEYYKLSTAVVANLGSIDGNVEYQTQANTSKELVSKALRKKGKLKEEISVLSSALASSGSLEFLKLAQAYNESKDYLNVEKSLDSFFENISYDLLDLKEIEVIKQTALRFQYRKKTKSLSYLLNYQALSDSINIRLERIKQTSRDIEAGGFQNVLRLEVLQKDKEMSDKTMNHLMKESELQAAILGSQKTIIYLLCGVLLIGLLVLFYIIRVSKQRRIANQQLALRSLRSQMNPHFIFNALNSVNSFISMSDEHSANRFLTEFSTLMRTVMENSEHDFIPLAKELDIIKIYVELEHFRFNDKFSYQLNIADDLDSEEYVLPPMIIQPYIENAIWHGLRYKETKGELIVSFVNEGDSLKITIQDDGIGREKSKEIKTKNQKKNKSTALKNINERVRLFADLHKIKVEVSIADLYQDGSGTVVTLLIPQVNHG